MFLALQGVFKNYADQRLELKNNFSWKDGICEALLAAGDDGAEPGLTAGGGHRNDRFLAKTTLYRSVEERGINEIDFFKVYLGDSNRQPQPSH